MDNENKSFDRSKYIALFSLAVAVVIVYLLLSGLSEIMGTVTRIIGPILGGIFIAFLLNPVLVWFTARFKKLFGKSKSLSERAKNKFTKLLSISFTMLFGLLFVAALFLMIIPEAINSIMKLAGEASGYVEYFQYFLSTLPFDDNIVSETLDKIVLEVVGVIEKWLTTDLPQTLNTLINFAKEGVSVVFNTFVSFIVAIYVMKDKDKFISEGKKAVYALFSKNTANYVVNTARHGYKLFGSFLSGKIIDSAIIGVLCFIFMSIFGMSYSLLISCIIGLFNIIPLFGPYIGGVASVFFLLIIDPKMALGFAVLIIVLQTFDGNILGPMILGQRTGLSEFWITFALLFFGGLFGLMGMILGIPLLAVIFYIFESFITKRLRSKNLPEDSKAYLNVDKLTDEGFTQLPEADPKIKFSLKDINKRRKAKKMSEDEDKE